MADEKTTAETQGAETQTAENKSTEGTETKTETQTAKTEETATGKTFTQDDINRMLAKEKREWEKKVTEAEQRAKLSEDERTKAELQDAKTQLAERDKRDAAIDQAQKAGVKNARLFYNAYKNDLETDAKGVITNFQDVLAAAKAESPELFITAAQGSADGGEGKDKGPALTKEMVDKMTPDEINKRWDEVSQFLASQK
jgi:tRNA uridine 5-carbamoylmethylation protein Kti12